MGIFDLMLQNETRERFVECRDNAFGETKKAKKEIREYVFSECCTNDIERLAAGDFFIAPPEEKAVYKRFGAKKRIIYLFSPKERILMRYMAFVLGEEYDYIFENSLYSFRKSQNAISMVKHIKKISRLEKGYKIRADLKSYFNSIDEEKLVEITDQVFSGDPAFAEFIRWLLLRREYMVNKTVKKGHPGAIPGMPLSNFLPNIYLMDMDSIFRRNCRFYARYSDDIFILTDTQEQMLNCRKMLEDILREKGLQFNEEKTRFIMPGESFEIMGFKVSGKEIDISDSSIAKIERKVKRRAEKILYQKRKKGFSDEEAMRRMIVVVNKMLFYKDENKHVLNWTMWAFPAITTTKGLKKIDAIMQKYIRYAATGTLSERKYRAKYKQMQKLGYKTMVNAYYKEFLEQ
ncbi:MAG: reverse transcriptase domain-containing protein [Lachnospira sp.]